jgi:hypothetical protein
MRTKKLFVAFGLLTGFGLGFGLAVASSNSVYQQGYTTTEIACVPQCTTNRDCVEGICGTTGGICKPGLFTRSGRTLAEWLISV